MNCADFGRLQRLGLTMPTAVTKWTRRIENPLALVICIGLLVSLVVSMLVLSRVLPSAPQTKFVGEGRILHPMAASNMCRAIFFDINTGERKGEEVVPCGLTPRKFDDAIAAGKFDAVRDGFKKR